MLYHNQPLKGVYLASQLIAIPFVYLPYWLLISIPNFFNPPSGRSRIHATSRHIKISFLRRVMLVIQK